jgi:uncharacterized RDD family membrane protein YckC
MRVLALDHRTLKAFTLNEHKKTAVPSDAIGPRAGNELAEYATIVLLALLAWFLAWI